MTGPGRISLMAAGELRDALTAAQRGDQATAVAALMAIDTDSWHAIQDRLNAMDGSLADPLTAVSRTRTAPTTRPGP